MLSNKTGVVIIEGHVQGLANARALGEVGIPVYVVDVGECVAQYSKYCKKYFKCPSYLSDDFSDFLINLAKKEGLKDWILLPSNDHGVYSISRNKDRLKGYYKIISPDWNIFNKIYNKENLLKLAEEIGVPIPYTYYHQDNNIKNFKLQYPVITKGKTGLTFYKVMGKKAFLSESNEELKANLEQIKTKYPLNNCFTQSVIKSTKSNYTVSFTAFAINGEIKAHWTGEKLREHPSQFGTATLCRSMYDESVHELSKKLIKEFNFTGVCEIEFLLDHRDNKYKLIEINARTWLWVGLAIACGVNYPLYIYNFLNNIETEYPEKYQLDKFWRSIFTDTIYSYLSVFRKKLSLKEYKKSLKGDIVFAVRSKDDPKPFRKMFKILIKRSQRV